MTYKKILIILTAIALIVGGVVAGNLLFPRTQPDPIDPPIDLTQAEQSFNSFTSAAKSELDPENLERIIGSSSSSSFSNQISSSNRGPFTEVNQASIKNFGDDDTLLLELQAQDVQNLSDQLNLRNIGEQVLMFLDPLISTPDNFYYLKLGDTYKYIGTGIKTVEKITINDSTYWLIIQTDIYQLPKVAVFNQDFTVKREIPIFIQENNSNAPQDRVYLIYDSIKSISGTSVVLSVKNGNTSGSKLMDFNIDLTQFTGF